MAKLVIYKMISREINDNLTLYRLNIQLHVDNYKIGFSFHCALNWISICFYERVFKVRTFVSNRGRSKKEFYILLQ